MNIGPLNSRCRIEYQAATQSEVDGSDVVTWTLIPGGVRWCGLQDEMPSRSEALRQGAVVAARRTRCRLRYCTDIDSSMRVIINRPEPQTYQIIGGPAILGDKDGIEIMLERVSTDG